MTGSPISLLVAIPFYFRPARLAYLAEVLKAFALYDIERLDAVIFTNTAQADELDMLSVLLGQILPRRQTRIESCLDLDSPYDLTWRHKALIKSDFCGSRSRYTHFIHVEDDIRLDFANFKYFMTFRTLLRPYGLLPGYLRIEYSERLHRYVHVDNFQKTILPESFGLDFGDVAFVNLANPYFGLFILDQELAQEYVTTRSFTQAESADVTPMGIPERAAMGLCFENIPDSFSSRYVVPVVKSSDSPPPQSWISHLPNNYALNDDTPFSRLPIDEIFAS